MTAPSIERFFQSEWQLTSSDVPERRRMIAFDIPLPDILPLPSKEQVRAGLLHMPLPVSRASNTNFCANTKMSLAMLREQSTSTWLSVTAKGVNLAKFIDFRDPVDLSENFEPVCPELNAPSPLLTLDHLPASHLRSQFIYYKPEKALTDVWP
ncbi:unnamed protein product [Gongylonema pulchrum]|uniref:JmjC domain-containing protein n=1 Tax=Gongylonema pulchrum TaxID=637853 RepID=A0A183CUD3_9BILA|nr:unnamed protein product [Gongylonema pulchrum]